MTGAAYVISKQIGNSYIWDKVRVVGGAYGGFCDFSPHNGMFTFLSYRDPNLLATLDNYDGAVDFLRNVEVRSPGLRLLSPLWAARDCLSWKILSVGRQLWGKVGEGDAIGTPRSKPHPSSVAGRGLQSGRCRS